jgi:hypothetical protein
LGRAYRETDEAHADLETVISYMIGGEYNKPLRVVVFNTAEGWSRDGSEDIAWEIIKRARDDHALPQSTLDFVALHVEDDQALRALSSVME